MIVRPGAPAEAKPEVEIRPLAEADLPAADQIMRVAFGTFLAVPDPTSFMGDADYVRSRWRTAPDAAFGAEVGGSLVGSNFAANWGSVGFFGPLTIHPDQWDRGIGKRLMEPVLALFAKWGTTHAGLYTFADSRKHVGLYQRFGFWPQFITAIMSKPVGPQGRAAQWTGFSALHEGEQESILEACRELSDEVHAGLSLSGEIVAVAAQALGDTVLLWDDSGLLGFAICHCGPGTEAGSGTCYVKFGAVRPGSNARRGFRYLLHACEEMAAANGLSRLVAGVSTARHEAYRDMLAYGFRTDTQGLAMHRPNSPGYSRPGIFVIDDWR